jgi:hypothetical protein
MSHRIAAVVAPGDEPGRPGGDRDGFANNGP